MRSLHERTLILDPGVFNRCLNLDLRRQQHAAELSPNNRQPVAKHYRTRNVQLSRQQHTCCSTPSPGPPSVVIVEMRSAALHCQKPLCSDPRGTAPRQLLRDLVGGATMAEAGAGNCAARPQLASH